MRKSCPVVPPANRIQVDVAGHTLSLSNLDKVLYPQAGFTKGEVIDYYSRIAPYVLPHLRNRALTLKRYPNGVERGHFYEKQCPRHAPDWVRRERVGDIDFVVCDDLPTLVWLANLADLELHPSLAHVDDPAAPVILAFDLDPGKPATIVECAEVALRLRHALRAVGMECFAKTSGSKGMQVYAPLNTPATYPQTRAVSKMVAQVLERSEPDLVVSAMTKSQRTGKVFIDWSQNAEHKTTVGAYSLRAMDRPTVSTPLEWDEVRAVVDSGDPEELVFSSAQVLERVGRLGDLFAGVAELKQSLPAL
jgi:bifunctional non-homologous end joining protein LigD